MNDLLPFYAPDGPERVGLVLRSGKIIELENVAEDTYVASTIALADLVRHESEAVATWHTHPGAGANLSLDDYQAFVNWPALRHHVVGSDGVRSYIVKNKRVIND